MTKQIIQNEAQCKKCGDIVWSAHTHDYKHCSCGSVMVDGGMSYLRRGGEPGNRIERSMQIESDDLMEIVKEAKRMRESNRNDLGVTLGIIRVLRDKGYLNMEKFW